MGGSVKILWLLWVLTPSTGWFVFDVYNSKEECQEMHFDMASIDSVDKHARGIEYSCRPSVGAGPQKPQKSLLLLYDGKGNLWG